MSTLQNLIETITHNLVENRDAVAINVEEEPEHLIITIQVADDDVGRVIGRNGSIANSMRTLLRAMSPRIAENKMITLNVTEERVLCWNPDLQAE